jgi:PAS domain S-box-containing protein
LSGGCILITIKDEWVPGIITSIALITLAVVIIGLPKGITQYTQQFLLIPAIVIAYLYPKRSITITAALGLVYFCAVMLLIESDLFTRIMAAGWAAILVVITAAVAFLSDTLRSEQARYRAVVEDQTEFIRRFKRDGTTVFVNEAYCRYFKTTAEGLIGTKFRHTIHPEDRNQVDAFFASLSAENPAGQIECRVIMPDGTVLWNAWYGRAITGANGKIEEYQEVGHDITTRINATTALAESEKRYRAIFDTTGTAMGIIRSDGTIVLANAEVEQLTGYTPEELRDGVSWDALVPETENNGLLRYLNAWFVPGEPTVRTFQAQILHRNGSVKHGVLTVDRIEGTDQLIVSVTDITAHKQTDRLIAVINRINQRIIREVAPKDLLDAACREFQSIRDAYLVAMALLRKDGGLETVAISDEQCKELHESCLESEWVGHALSNEIGYAHDLPIPESENGEHPLPMKGIAIPMNDGDAIRGVLLVYSLNSMYLKKTELESLLTLSNDLAVALKSFDLEEQKRLALEQIEVNMEQMAILNDHIRNPLQTMVGWADLEGGALAEKILEQAREIDEIVHKLDQGWMHSEKIREFLRKHYAISRDGEKGSAAKATAGEPAPMDEDPASLPPF